MFDDDDGGGTPPVDTEIHHAADGGDGTPPVPTQIHQIVGAFQSYGEKPDYSIPVPTLAFPTTGKKDLVLELRVTPDTMKAFKAYKAKHDMVEIRVVANE